jgi:hypothetical protein
MLWNPLWVTGYGVAPIPLAAGAPRPVPLPGVNAKASGSGDRGHRPHRRWLCAGTCLPSVPSSFDGRDAGQ